jgi:predicted DNA-binding transcriptional regulator AlpA
MVAAGEAFGEDFPPVSVVIATSFGVWLTYFKSLGHDEDRAALAWQLVETTKEVVMTTSEPLWSHQQTADFLGIPAATLYQFNHKRTGPRSYKVGKHRKYTREDVLAWLKTRSSDPDGE